MADTRTRASRATSLVIEPTGSVVLDGQRIKLPPMSFALLKSLAERPGSGFPSSQLPELAWPGFHLVQKDVHWHIWQTRKLVGDLERENPDRLISSRPHFGYFVNLPAEAIRIQEVESPAIQQVIVLPEAESEDLQVVPSPPREREDPDEVPVPLDVRPVEQDTKERNEPFMDSPDPDEVPVRLDLAPVPNPLAGDVIARRRGRRWRVYASIFAAAVMTVTGLATWAMRSEADPATSERSTGTVSEAPSYPKERQARPQRSRKSIAPRGEGARSRPNDRAGDTSTSAQQVVTATVPDVGQAPAPSGEQSSEPNEKKAVAALPPAPTNHLYHLRNPETGDNFVTTDPNAVADYEGRGYVGGAVGRVYARAEDGTKPVSTNGGLAYIFATADAETDPAVRLVALYYSSKGGDFFYTTDRALASADGWSASLAGYVGAP